ncbi:Ig-like domain-containing protein [Roseivirga spongicola]|uniref:Ig-like domain-containing protein n=8 Tax=Roseivirga TaxID=290180 RepID=UPI002AC8F491|nr:Ig-like domain-containing protein [Roseivirga spongicola]WPZ10885.1 Ig-like domain-containing protein [Roseivirga spongicola]
MINFNSLNKSVMKNMGSALVNMAMIAFPLFSFTELKAPRFASPSPGTMGFGSGTELLASSTNPSADQSKSAFLNGFDVSMTSSDSRVIALATSGNGAGTDVTGGGSDAALTFTGGGTGTTNSSTLSTDDGSEVGITGFDFAYERNIGTAAEDFTITGKRDGVTVGTLALSVGHKTLASVDLTTPTTGSFANIDELVITPDAGIIGGWSIDDLVIVAAASANNAPTDIALTSTSINQSATGINATVGTLSSTDADGGDTHTYSLVSGSGSTDNASFNISGSTLRTGGALAAGTYDIRINTNDGTDDFAEEFTITVVDNVAPSAPSTPDLATSSDSGNEEHTAGSTSDNLTNDTTPAFEGTAEAGSTVKIISNVDGEVGSGIATGGTYSITTSALTAGAHTITATATDGSANTSSASSALSITIDTTSPTVSISTTSSNPTNDNPIPVTITFNSEADNMTENDITVVNGTTSNFVSPDSTSFYVDVTPSGNGAVQVSLGAGTAFDRAGNANTVSNTLSVTYDGTAPAFSSVSPSSSSSVSNANVGYTLSEAIASGTVTFTRTGGSADGSSPHVVNLTGSELNAGVRASAALTNAPSLVSGTIYTISFNGQDAAGNSATTVDVTNVTFDTTAPTLVSSNPADDATGFNISDNLTLTFSENIAFGTGSILVMDEKDGSRSFLIDAASPGTQASISGAVLTINPSANLDPSSLYSVQISPTAIDDLAGNGYAGIYNSTSYNFSTNFPPTVSVNNGLTMNQGATGLIDTGKLNATDTESSASDITFTITTAATNGTLFVDTNPSNTYNAGDVLLSANATFTLDDLNNDKIRYTNSSGTSDSFVFKVSDPNGGELTNQTFNITLNDVTPPSITSLGLNNSNAFVEIFANEGLYSTNGGSGALEISDIDISISGGTATNPVITSLKQLNGTSDLVGGESNLRVNFTTTGVADGGEIVTINFADGSSVFDVAGNAAAATQSNNTRILNDLVDPYITGVSLAADNSYIDVIFNEGVYEDNCGGGGLTVADFDLKISGGSATFNTISSVKQNNSTVEASASALSGGETTIRIFFSVTGTPDGDETLEVDLKANEVFDINGRTAIADQTANNTATMNDKAAPRISSIVRQSPTTSHTNADQVSWDITFSEVVSNVGPEDLTVLGTTGTVTSVSNPSGNTYRITISGGNMESLEGTITLGFVNGHVVKDAGGNALINTVPTGTWDNTYAIDNTAPAITSFTRKNPTSSLTSVSQLVFLATFSEDVTSVDLNDFAVTGLTGASIAVSQLTASTYDVTVSGGDISTYSGVVGLNLSSPNITDLAGNALPITEPTTDETYSLDNTAPTITSITVPSDGSYETGEHLDFTLTFSEVVNVDEGCVNPPALNITVGSNTRAAHYLSGTNSNSVKFRYTVQASDSDTDGVSINSFSVGDGVVYDAVGNSMVEDLPSNMPSTADVLVNICASATIANAGSDEEVCGGSATLAANAASGYNETGAWSVVSGAGGSFSDVNSPTATFTGIRGANYTLRWTISNGICTNSTDDVVITFDEAVTANAGSDQNVCGTSTFLGASYSTGNTGSWSILSGAGGSITSPSSPFSSFSGVVGTVYTLQWTETNGSCSDNDTVKITFFDNPTPANAGLDKDICGPTALSANAASGFGETGTWSVVAGAGGSFSDANSPTATFTGTEGVNYTLRWTISNGVCPISSDDVVITVEVNDVEANAGSDQNVCGTQTFLGAVYSTGSTGSWSILSGAGGTITTPTSNTSVFTGTVGTTYTLQWTENSGTCSDTDIVEITFFDNVTVAAAGSDQETCNTSVTMAANAASGFRETGTWSVVSGAGGGFADANSPTSSFTGTKGVSYTLRWTISNGVCPISSDDVVVTLSDDVTANAGSDQNVCGTNTFLGASYSTGNTGSWSILSGAGGSITSPSSPFSSFSGVVGTVYTLQWTETNGSCSDNDTVKITFFDNPTPANAGLDKDICGPTALSANTASGFRETGTWSVVAGAGGSFSDANSPTATFTGTEGVNYTLRWTISNGVCPISSDDVVITVEVNDVEADAGSDQNVCGTQTFLGAVYSTGSTGSWSILSGAGGSVTTPSSNTSKFTGTVGTTYTLQWTENSGTCSDTDIVEITFFDNVTVAAAGSDQETCNTSVTMAANAASGFRETGTWSVVSGAGGSFADANSPISTFTGTKGVSYTLRWTISNGVCPISSDDVVVTLSDDVTANAGADQNVCGTNTFLGASFSTGSTGSWSILSGAGGTITTPTSAISTFKGKVGTTYTLQWTENNGSCSDNDTVEITFFDNVTVAAAGVDQKIDGALATMNATLAGNTASGFRETGTWSEVAGDGNSVFSDASSATSTFTGTVGVTYTLRWTISNGVCPISSDDVLIEFANNAGFTITETASSTEVDESGSTDTFDVVLDSEPASDVVINVSSGSTSEVTVDQSSLIFTSGNWNVPQTVTVQGVDDSKVDTDKSVKITLSIDDAASHDNYDAVIDQSVSVINENTTTASVTAADVSIAEADGTATVTFTLDNAVEGGLSVDVSTVNGTATGGVDFSPITAQTIMFDGTAGETETLDISITADAIVEADETITVSMSNLTPVTVSSTDIDITDGATVTINNDDQATVTIADASGAEADGAITLTATLDNAVDGGFFVELNTADVTALSTSDYTALISQKLTFSGTAGEQQTFTITPTDDSIEESTETLTVSMSNISAGTVDKNNIDITDGATITITDEDDNTAPVGYSVTLDDALIGSAETAISTFTFAGAEIGTTYNYMVNSDNGGTKVAGSGTIATATDQVTLTDLSGLNDGTLTLSVTLTDASSNVGTVVTAQATIDQTMEATLLPADDAIDVLPDAKLSMDFGENVYKGTGNIIIAQSSNDEVLETIDVTSTNVVVNGSEVTITPTNLLLPPSTEFYVSIEIGAITDDAGNSYSGATNKTAWTFTTIAAPVVTATTVPTAETYAIGDKLTFETSFTLPVTITGTPSLPITIGTETKAATLSGTVSESNTATFTYTITEGDLDTDGITVGSTIDLNGATIVDEFGTDAILTLKNTASTANVNVDGIRATPSITSVVSDLTNAAFTVTVTYDEPVSGLTAEDLNITNGTADNLTVVTAGLVWTADITPTADGAITVAVAAAAVTDAAGNTSVASAAEIATTFDGTAPAITSIARVESERVNTGVDKLNFTVKFSENVTGVDASDFQVATTGTATASVNTVTQVDGKTYTVNVNGISGEGTIGLNAKDDDSIIDAATNALASAFTGEVYTTNFVATDIALSTTSIQENNAVGTEIGAFSTTDADAGDSHTYTLVSGTGDADNASFTITGNKLLAAEVFDFETKNSYSIRVKTDDSFGGTYEEVFTIEIINEAEAVIVVTGEGTFDETILGLSATKSWTIENRGEAATEVRIISSSQGFSVNPGSVQLNPGDTKNITAVFTPTEAKVYNGVVVFNYDITNSIQDNVLEIGLSGEGVIVTGLDNGQISEEQIGVFPNPASTYVTIDLSELSGMPLNIQMISPTGVSRLEKEGYDKSELTIDVTNFESGLYIIQFSNERSLVRKKVLIRK